MSTTVKPQPKPRLIVVAGFGRNDDGELVPALDPQQQHSEDRAIRLAKGLAGKHPGVIAWSRDADSRLGEYGRPTTLFTVGDVTWSDLGSMTRLTFAELLEKAAADINHVDRAELQILLRRAALRHRNVDGFLLDPEWEDALTTVTVELGVSRSNAIRAIMRDWLTANRYLPAHMVDEESEVEGNA